MNLLHLRMSKSLNKISPQISKHQPITPGNKIPLWIMIIEMYLCALFFLFIIDELQNEGPKPTDSAIVPLYCCWYPLSLGEGCSASSLPEGCFPNHINEERCSNLCCRAAASAQGAVLFTLYLY